MRKPDIVRRDITNSNGLAWNRANNKLYYIDTPTLKIVEFDYYDENGTISGMIYFIKGILNMTISVYYFRL